MFAVPGWSVDSTSIAQEKATTKADGISTTTSKKRKNTLPHADQASKISGSELEKLWNARDGSSRTSTPKQARKNNQNPEKRDSAKHDRRRSEQSSYGAEESVGVDKKKRKKDKDKHDFEERPEAREQPPQDRRDRTLKSKPTKLSNSDNENTSFPRDKILQTLPPAPPAPTTLTPLQAKMRSKLTSARFRHLNETLYTTSSSAAMDLFTTSPDLFAEYHAGFSQQVKDSWPVNPVDKYIAAIKSRAAIPSLGENDKKSKAIAGGLPLPRRPKTSLCTIADLGCGDAPLARSCQSPIKSQKLKFHNFDLHAPNTQVTKADISKLPLRDGEVDIAVLCLSLMGTNWIAFVEEAWRILRGDGKGECWVSEVKSRFGRVGRWQKGEAVENSVGKKRNRQKQSKQDDEVDPGKPVFAEEVTETAGDETDISAFVKVFTRRGFQLREGSVDKSNKMFVSIVFTKSGVPTAGIHKGLKWTGREYQKIEEKMTRGGDDEAMTPQEEAKVLKPCVYKTR